MTNHNPDLDALNTYLCVVALVAEGRREDAFALITNLEPTEQIDMWIAGCSITFALAGVVGASCGVQAADIPTWLRTMADPDVDLDDLKGNQ